MRARPWLLRWSIRSITQSLSVLNETWISETQLLEASAWQNRHYPTSVARLAISVVWGPLEFDCKMKSKKYIAHNKGLFVTTDCWSTPVHLRFMNQEVRLACWGGANTALCSQVVTGFYWLNSQCPWEWCKSRSLFSSSSPTHIVLYLFIDEENMFHLHTVLCLHQDTVCPTVCVYFLENAWGGLLHLWLEALKG